MFKKVRKIAATLPDNLPLGLGPFSLCPSAKNKTKRLLQEMLWVWTTYDTVSNQAHCTSICTLLASQIACCLEGWKAKAIVTLPAIASAYAQSIQFQTFTAIMEYHGGGWATSLPSIATLELCHEQNV